MLGLVVTEVIEMLVLWSFGTYFFAFRPESQNPQRDEVSRNRLFSLRAAPAFRVRRNIAKSNQIDVIALAVLGNL